MMFNIKTKKTCETSTVRFYEKPAPRRRELWLLTEVITVLGHDLSRQSLKISVCFVIKKGSSKHVTSFVHKICSWFI